MKMTISYADCCGERNNCIYPNKFIVDNSTKPEDLSRILSRDYSGSVFENNYRSNANFKYADALGMDVDNDFSDDEKEWITPKNIDEQFPGVPFIIHYSRNHMKPKNGKAPRPKFHVIFEIEPTESAEEYAKLKEKLLAYFPYFDGNCKDSARFFFGTPGAQIEIHGGEV